MRKSIFFAVAAVGVLCSCSQDDAIGNGIGSGEFDGRMPIQIGMSQGGSVVTRGTGTVGDLGVDNSWAGQDIKVYMFNKNTLDYAIDADGAVIYNDYDFVAPTGTASGLATAKDQSLKYYPVTGEFDFIGYRLDGAIGTPAVPTINDDSLQIGVTIDGSQDVMIADALLSEEERTQLDGQGIDTTRIYSAYSARRNVQPTLVFKHLLARLKFDIIGGNKASCDSVDVDGKQYGVRIDSIKVVSKSNGVLTIATPGEYHTGIGTLVFDGSKDTLLLKQRAAADVDGNQELETMEEVIPTWNGITNVADTVSAGEALLVAPDDEYKIIITLKQNVKASVSADASDNLVEKKFVMEDYIRFADASSSKFEAGKSYNVRIKVYGLNRIDITTELTPWEDGGTIDLDPMDKPNQSVSD